MTELKQLIISEFLEATDKGYNISTVEQMIATLDELINESMKEYEEQPQEKIVARVQHMQRVSFLVLNMLNSLKKVKPIELKKKDIKNLFIAAYIHDIRKFSFNHGRTGGQYLARKLLGNPFISDEDRGFICALVYYHDEKDLEVNKEQYYLEMQNYAIEKAGGSLQGNKGPVLYEYLYLLHAADKLEKVPRKVKWPV